jgi:hypothetical protein
MNDSYDHAPAGPAARRVLAERKNAGIQVTLIWAQDTNAASVLVRDDGTDDQVELSVETGANALERSTIRTRTPHGVASTISSGDLGDLADLRRSVARVQQRAGSRWKTSRTHTRTRMNAGLTVC